MAENKEITGMVELTPEDKQKLIGGANISKLAEQAAVNKEEPTPPVVDKEIEKPADTPKVDDKPADGKAPTEDVPQAFDISFFNKQFGSEYETEDSIKEALDGSNKIGDLQKQIDTIPSLQEELEVLREASDPMQYFRSEDDYRVAQYQKAFPDKDASMVAKLFSTDLTQADDFDVLVWTKMLDNPNLDGGETGARELVAHLNGIEDHTDLSELDTLTKNQLKVAAREERMKVATLKEGVQLPEKKDYESLKEQRTTEATQRLEKLTEDWSTVSDAIVKGYPDIVINNTDKEGNVSEFFKYSVGKDLGEDIIKPTVDSFIKAGIPVDEKSAQILGAAIHKEFVYQNFDKMVRAAVKNHTAELEQKTLEDQHNPGAPKDQERPKEGANDLTAKIMHDLKHGAQTPMKAH